MKMDRSLILKGIRLKDYMLQGTLQATRLVRFILVLEGRLGQQLYLAF